jgi:hypothetical protein
VLSKQVGTSRGVGAVFDSLAPFRFTQHTVSLLINKSDFDPRDKEQAPLFYNTCNPYRPELANIEIIPHTKKQ